MSSNKPEEKPITDGLATASTVDLIRHAISFLVGIVLSRLVKHNLLTGDEVAYLLGFLPSLVFNVGFALWKRYKQRQHIQTALLMPAGSTVEQLKTAISDAPPVKVLSASDDKVVVEKEADPQ